MKVHHITENPLVRGLGKIVANPQNQPGPGKFNYRPAAGGGFEMLKPNGGVYGTVNSEARAVSGSIKFNTVKNKHGINSPQFKSAFRQATQRLGIALDVKGKTPGMIKKTANTIKKGANTIKKVPGGGKVVGWGSKILGVAGRSTKGGFVFGILGIYDMAEELDRWGNIYVNEGCNLNSKRLDAQEARIRKLIVENVIMVASGIGMAASGVIRTLGTFLAALPIAGWIATALAWVSAGVLGSMIAKLLSNTKLANYVADHLLSSVITEDSIKMIAFANCPKESLSEDWESRINEDLKNIKQKGKQAEQKAADEIKKQFLSDPELNKILKITQKKVKSGEVEYVKSKNS